MNLPIVRRLLAMFLSGAVVLAASLGVSPASVRGGIRHTDPAQVVPLAQISPEHRENVAEVISSATLHRQGTADSFPCHPQLYLSLLNEPALTLALWRDLNTTNMPSPTLRQVGPDRYQGTDGSGAAATWDFVYRSPRLHVMLCHLDYASPRGSTKLNGRIVVIVHTDYFRKGKAEHWVRHTIEMFVKVDSKGWRTVAKTVRPVLEKVLDDQVQEAGWFVSLMGRLVEMHPNWACQVVDQAPEVRTEARQSFRTLVQQTRRPGASTGRPILADNARSGETKMR